VEQTDGSFKSTPFYVKFGKIGVLKAKEKTVDIEINGTEISQSMVLDDFGIAHFPNKVKVSELHESKDLSIDTLPDRVKIRTESGDGISPLTRVRRNSEPSPTDPEGEGGSICAASRALSNPDLSVNSTAENVGNETGTTAGGQPAEDVLSLSATELAEFNLRPGINDATFSITTQFQGEIRIYQLRE
jgi:phosphatidate phosphatase PAH1